MKKYTMYNYWNEICENRSRETLMEFCNRAKFAQFEKDYAIRINTLNGDIKTVQKKYIQHDEAGEQIRDAENKPVFIDGMTEDMLNTEFSLLMAQDISEPYRNLKFDHLKLVKKDETTATEIPAPVETKEVAMSVVEGESGSTEQKQEDPATVENQVEK